MLSSLNKVIINTPFIITPFYIEKLGYTGVIPTFLIFAPKHRLRVLGEAVLIIKCFEHKY